MPSDKLGKFEGFSPETLMFLNELRKNNNKTWFDEHRHEYREYLLEPFKRLVADLGVFMLSIDPLLEISPSVGKTVSRINRDTRFSNNKKPYKQNMWFVFKRPSLEPLAIPGIYFELTPDYYSYGMGIYSADRKTMDNFRRTIDENMPEFREIWSLYKKQSIFKLEGESYKKILDKSLSGELLNWYQKKNMYFNVDIPFEGNLFSRNLLAELSEGFTLLKPFYEFFWKLIGK